MMLINFDASCDNFPSCSFNPLSVTCLVHDIDTRWLHLLAFQPTTKVALATMLNFSCSLLVCAILNVNFTVTRILNHEWVKLYSIIERNSKKRFDISCHKQ